VIEKVDKDEFILSCDHCGDECGDECGEIFETFYDAVEYKKDKDNAWRTIKDKNNDWYDLCPACSTPEIIRKLKGAGDL
jgi:hypothetical protein